VRIQRLSTAGWRNLAPTTLEPGPTATVLFGNNGQGKTNWLEAICFGISFRSFRSRNRTDVIQWESASASVQLALSVDRLDREIVAEVGRTRSRFLLDGKAVRRDAPGLRHVASVLFVPEDLRLPRASPNERRRFIDLAVFGSDRGYYREAQIYQRVLKNRNALLKSSDRPDETVLQTLDEQLAEAGAVVVEKRRSVVEDLSPRVCRLFASIHDALEVRLSYEGPKEISGVGSRKELTAGLLEGLRKRRGLDMRRRYSGYGPHCDDIGFHLSQHLVRDHGSQGQMRSLVLAVKLAEVERLRDANGEAPVLLLDDVASELDSVRRQRLFETIADLPGQTFISVTDRDFLPQLPARRDFELSHGQARPARS